MSAGAGDALLSRLLVFERSLRRLGLDVHTGRMLDVVEALPHVDSAGATTSSTCCARCSCTVTTTSTPSVAPSTPSGDRQLRALRRADAGSGSAPGPDRAAPDREAGGLLETQVDTSAIDHEDDSIDVPAWSDVEALSRKDFAEFTDAELAAARAAIERLEWQPGLRRTRRWVAGRGSRLDLRRALRASVRTGGDMVRLPRRVRRVRPRPIVLLCDVSGSMEVYSRLLVHFAHAITRRHRRVEAFLFSTRLTRITRELRKPHIGDAVDAVSRAVPDWSGGTRIGESLQEFHRRWGRRALARAPVVLLVSDGWDRGEPDVLEAAVSRLQRSSHRLIWLNPLIGTTDYQPLTRGLQAALPYVDDFLPARSLRDLADLTAIWAD